MTPFCGEQAFAPTSLEGEQGRGGRSRQRPRTPGPTFLGCSLKSSLTCPAALLLGPAQDRRVAEKPACWSPQLHVEHCRGP